MGKQGRKFEKGFKNQIIQEKWNQLCCRSTPGSRKYQISGSIIRWRRQAKQGGLKTTPSLREQCWSGRTATQGEISRAVSGMDH